MICVWKFYLSVSSTRLNHAHPRRSIDTVEACKSDQMSLIATFDFLGGVAFLSCWCWCLVILSGGWCSCVVDSINDLRFLFSNFQTQIPREKESTGSCRYYLHRENPWGWVLKEKRKFSWKRGTPVIEHFKYFSLLFQQRNCVYKFYTQQFKAKRFSHSSTYKYVFRTSHTMFLLNSP